MIQHYFLSAWIPEPDQSHTYSTRVTRGQPASILLVSPVLHHWRIGPGPIRSIQLAQSSTQAQRISTDSAGNFALPRSECGLRLAVVDSTALCSGCLPRFTRLVGNWGFAIILLTVADQGPFLNCRPPATNQWPTCDASSQKCRILREQYADDKQKQSQAMMELYRKEKINPDGGLSSYSCPDAGIYCTCTGC